MPRARLRVRPEAEADVQESYVWYERQAQGLGEALFMELDRLYGAIEERPHIYPEIHKNIRRAMTRRFPFAVFHLIAGDQIEVLAVLHQMRSPDRWRERLTS